MSFINAIVFLIVMFTEKHKQNNFHFVINERKEAAMLRKYCCGVDKITDMTIGISGKAAAGKNLAAAYFERHGFVILDADKIGIEALSVCKEALTSAFGREILDEKGEVNRKKLGARVFKDKKELARLNAISHPYIIGRVRAGIIACAPQPVAVNAALLPYWPIDEIEAIVWIRAPFFIRLKRALYRDQRGICFILRRIMAQHRLSAKLFFKKVDIYNVDNAWGTAELERRLDTVLRRLSEKDKVNADAK